MEEYWHTTLAENLVENFRNFKPNAGKGRPYKGCLIGKEALTRLKVCLGGLYSEIPGIQGLPIQAYLLSLKFAD